MLLAFYKTLWGAVATHGQSARAAHARGIRFPPGFYPLGRLDFDSEGLLLLSDEPGLNTRLLESEARTSNDLLGADRGVIDAPALRELEAA